MNFKNYEFVPYYRASTPRQGKSGLGLRDQQKVIRKTVEQLQGRILLEFKEIETGTNKRKRPTLSKALEYCKNNNAVLIVSRLDRLSRSVAFMSKLLESDQKFYFCDQPNLDKTTLYILTAIAQKEAENIQKNVRSAIAVRLAEIAEQTKEIQTQITRSIKQGNMAQVNRLEAKLLSIKWGNAQCFSAKGRKAGADANVKKALEDESNLKAMKMIMLMKPNTKSLSSIAKALNNVGLSTSKGKPFTPMQISRIINRYKKYPEYLEQEISL